MAKKKTKHVYSDMAELRISDQVVKEFITSKQNDTVGDADFESTIDMLECRRTEKDYDWMTDVFIPEYPSIHLTEASMWANQYFQSRDFVDVFMEDGDKLSKSKAQAAKRFINAMLNCKELYHYPKYMRARSINSTRGYVIAICSWKQQLKDIQIPFKKVIQTGQDMYGNPQYQQVTDMKDDVDPVVDRFEYDIPDPRNVAMDNTYCYSIQDKEWVTIRSEVSYEQLLVNRDANGYINLNLVKDMGEDPNEQTETARETRDKDEEGHNWERETKLYDYLERFGKTWAVVDETDEEGYPVKISPPYDSKGQMRDSAELIETITGVLYRGAQKLLIRFQPTPFRTSKGIPFRPVIRGLCYIHPTKDVGMSDGKYAMELQTLINDMMNMGIDRAKLATMPTLKVRRYALEDNDSIYFEPEHSMLVENPDDITEFKIEDNIKGALDVVGLGISKMQQVEAIYPTTMGDLPGKSSTTATAVSGAESKTNLRSNYKSLTFEYTFLNEFYWMMLQMGYQFMHEKTAMKIMKEDAQNFDPDGDFTYMPVTSNIEVEYNKDKKAQRIDQMIGRIANIPNPAVIPIVAYLVGWQAKLLGAEYQELEEMIKSLAQTPNKDDKQEEGNAPKDAKGMPESNQNGQAMSLQEQGVRQGM